MIKLVSVGKLRPIENQVNMGKNFMENILLCSLNGKDPSQLHVIFSISGVKPKYTTSLIEEIFKAPMKRAMDNKSLETMFKGMWLQIVHIFFHHIG